MATSQLVNTDSIGDFTDVQPEKLRVCGNPRKGIISVRAGFYASRDAEFCVPEITGQYNLMLDLKIKVGHCGLYFMVQWFCLIS